MAIVVVVLIVLFAGLIDPIDEQLLLVDHILVLVHLGHILNTG